MSTFHASDDKASTPGSPFPGRVLAAAAVGLGMVAVPLLLHSHLVAPDDIEVVPIHIGLPDWPEGVPPLRVGFLSDTHCDSDRSTIRAARAAQLLMEQRPDIVLLGGDFVSDDAEPWAERCVEAIKQVSGAPLGAYAVLGNHDWWSGARFLLAESLAAAGITLLSNRALPITKDGKVWLVGLDSVCACASHPASALADVPDEAFKLLLVHEPDYADISPPGFSLQFSGHSHAGQIRLFGHAPVLPLFGRRYPKGLQKSKRHLVYTSRGVGSPAGGFRFACRPEVTIATLHPCPPGVAGMCG